ncbi:NAD(P)H-binding protein [Venatoribacter cucullus]|uniref:NAD(P)H-binding protein n=1 Tax=Venatoribacter cucullus TaxID=2661630 RepID=A0A9X7YQR6_9GAMM|nr:SDR family oxidoreductase [Venatoribacter cucullus]QQD25287.1 NAD(P)H-binding protein [Venatoribacter cucullus]
MARILIVGAGDIGGHLAVQLAAAGHSVWGLRRSDKPVGDGVTLIQADVADTETLQNLPDNLDILVYCVASPVFSKEGYHAYYYRGLRHILKALKGQKLQRAFFVSSSSVYHQMDGEWVDETSETRPSSFAGKEMLAAEEALLKADVPGTVVRFTGIYGPGRTRMIEQARQGGHCDPEPPVWTNRIHRDDCVGVLKFMIEQTLAGKALEPVYLATDDEPATLFDVLEWMKDRIGDVEPDHDLPEATRRANRRCSNKRLHELGYELQYRNYREGYDLLLTEMGLV